MRKPDAKQHVLFSYKSIEDRIPKKHPIRTLQKLVDQAFDCLDDDFEKLYSNVGRPSIAPEHKPREGYRYVSYSDRIV